jgi:UDP-N-acetylmuramate dehydrogenase
MLQGISLKTYNTLGIDVKAAFFSKLNNVSTLQVFIDSGVFAHHKYLILGNGSNILFSDNFRGVVVKNNLREQLHCYQDAQTKNLMIKASSGILMQHIFDKYLAVQAKTGVNSFGFENLADIPGTVGAAVVQNIGAYGVEQKDFFEECTAVDLSNGNSLTFKREDCDFDYRSSIFKKEKHYFITEVVWSIPLDSSPKLNYPDLQNLKNIANLTSQQVYDAVVKIRKAKIPNITKEPNAGSFFKNPLVTFEQLGRLQLIAPEVHYFATNNMAKISAAYLIEHAGLKGCRIGNVGISERHALIIVKYGDATGKEVIDFANYVIKTVKQKFDITLTPEVEIL